MFDAAGLDRTRTVCWQALSDDEGLRPFWSATGAAIDLVAQARALLPAFAAPRTAIPRLAALKAALARAGVLTEGGALERFLILSAAADAIDGVPRLGIDDHVKQTILQRFESFATLRVQEPPDLAHASFAEMAQIATLSRFPAGQLDWVVSGLPRSWLFRVPWRGLPRLMATILLELRGFGPAFFTHLSSTRRGRHVLLERESLRSYHRMARSMALQPAIRGMVTASWLHSPDTFAVSPHLSWLNRVFLENGGHVVRLGPADVESGVLHRSPERQKAYESGAFTPTQALVVWPRAAMLAWARQHDDLNDGESDLRSRVLVAQEANV